MRVLVAGDRADIGAVLAAYSVNHEGTVLSL